MGPEGGPKGVSMTCRSARPVAASASRSPAPPMMPTRIPAMCALHGLAETIARPPSQGGQRLLTSRPVMRALPLLLLTLLAGAAAAQKTATGCKDDNNDCREDCTVEYGSSSRTYQQLGNCLQKCKSKFDLCSE